MMMKINPMETAPFEHEDFDEAPSDIFVHKGAWATVTGTNDKIAGWIDTHELFADQLYRDQILPKQYTNTREPGEFGDGVTVEKQMTDLNEKALEAARASFVMENSLKRAISAYLETAQSEDKIDEVNP